MTPCHDDADSHRPGPGLKQFSVLDYDDQAEAHAWLCRRATPWFCFAKEREKKVDDAPVSCAAWCVLLLANAALRVRAESDSMPVLACCEGVRVGVQVGLLVPVPSGSWFFVG